MTLRTVAHEPTCNIPNCAKGYELNTAKVLDHGLLAYKRDGRITMFTKCGHASHA